MTVADRLAGSQGEERRWRSPMLSTKRRRPQRSSPGSRPQSSAVAGLADLHEPTRRLRRRRPGERAPAWLARVPYQGMRPRSSRTSVVPMAATQPATAGPPRPSRRRSGPSRRPAACPCGKRTGSADATSVSTVQKATPSSDLELAIGLPAVGRRGRAQSLALPETQESRPRARKHSEPRLRRYRASASAASMPRTYRAIPEL